MSGKHTVPEIAKCWSRQKVSEIRPRFQLYFVLRFIIKIKFLVEKKKCFVPEPVGKVLYDIVALYFVAVSHFIIVCQ